MTEATFKLREIWKKERAELKMRRKEIVEACTPILARHSGNAVGAEARAKDFSQITYEFDDLADAYANAVANAETKDEMDYFAKLLLAYARYPDGQSRPRLAMHYCRGLLNEAARQNEHVLTRLQRLRMKWRNPYRSVPQEYVDYPD